MFNHQTHFHPLSEMLSLFVQKMATVKWGGDDKVKIKSMGCDNNCRNLA